MNLIHELGRLIRSWWTQDRIQISPAEGRLLRVRPGDLLSIDHHDFEVVDRYIMERPHRRLLCLRCRAQSETAELFVAIGPECEAPSIRWETRHRVRTLGIEDIEVWPIDTRLR